MAKNFSINIKQTNWLLRQNEQFSVAHLAELREGQSPNDLPQLQDSLKN